MPEGLIQNCKGQIHSHISLIDDEYQLIIDLFAECISKIHYYTIGLSTFGLIEKADISVQSSQCLRAFYFKKLLFFSHTKY